MIRFAFALAVFLLFVPAAQAASFDCAKAGTSFERAICSSPELSKEDEILAQAYATALGGLSPEALGALKATQREWLDYAARTCSDDAQPIPGDYNDDQKQCLLSTMQSRVTTLEASRMLGGYRFYPLEGYLVEMDTEAEADAYNKVATKHYMTVKIDRTDDLAKAFNDYTDGLLLAQDVQLGEDSHLFEKGTQKLASGDVTADIDVQTSVKTVTSSRITLSTDVFWYGHGAAHGNYGTSYDHFLIAESRGLKADDVFKGKGWQAKLAKLVVAKLKEQLTDSYFADSEPQMHGLVADPSRWDFTDEGLIMQFQPYEVAAYAAGAVTVTVPWTDLQDNLTENAQTITASY
jgi:uncharacterized protein YecT (DUF1311 family)